MFNICEFVNEEQGLKNLSQNLGFLKFNTGNHYSTLAWILHRVKQWAEKRLKW